MVKTDLPHLFGDGSLRPSAEAFEVYGFAAQRPRYDFAAGLRPLHHATRDDAAAVAPLQSRTPRAAGAKVEVLLARCARARAGSSR